jgi:hypothetical protein
MIISKIKAIFYSAIAVSVIAGYIFVSSLISSNRALKSEIAIHEQNIESYENRLDDNMREKAILRLTAESLANSNDSILKELEKTRKKLKISLDKPGSVAANIDQSISTSDTVRIELPAECKFDTIISPNELTKFKIKYEDNSLIHTADINNSQKLYVYSSREFVNEYKNGWHRFWHFDWKKKDVSRYRIENTNDQIKNSNTIVVVTN